MIKSKGIIPLERHGKLLAHLEANRFYGILETHFEAGRIVRIRKLETLIEEDLAKLTQE